LAGAINDRLGQTHPNAVRITSDVQGLYLAHPIHPDWEKVQNNKGEVDLYLVDTVIDETGRVVDWEFVRGRDQQIQELIVAAMRQWRYTPARSGDKPVECRVTVSFGFHRGAS
jgi:hypothetical protein